MGKFKMEIAFVAMAVIFFVAIMVNGAERRAASAEYTFVINNLAEFLSQECRYVVDSAEEYDRCLNIATRLRENPSMIRGCPDVMCYERPEY